MTEAEIQDRADKLVASMLAKGLKAPSVSAQINSNAQPMVTCKWSDAREQYGSAYAFRRADTLAEAFEEAEGVVAAMPDAAERKLTEFMGALGNVIDLGRANGIEVAFLNPLVELSKKLSENAITHRTA